MAGLGGDGSPDSQELRCIMENHARFAESQDPVCDLQSVPGYCKEPWYPRKYIADPVVA